MKSNNLNRERRHRAVILLLCLCVVMALACEVATLPILPSATPSPTPTNVYTATPRTTLTPSPTPEPRDTGWQPAAIGSEIRSVEVYTSYGLERLTIVRFNPTQVRFRVLYAQGDPRALGTWAYENSALLVVNGGYFSEDYKALGLTVASGQVYGTSYGDYAGMFAVSQEEIPSVRWLRVWPYNPGERLREVAQSFPVLVKPGGVMGFPPDGDAGNPARRSIVAQDFTGNILFLIAPRGYFNLHELAVWLSECDLAIDTALNLDGGPSAGLWMPGYATVDSIVPVPQVIAVLSQ